MLAAAGPPAGTSLHGVTERAGSDGDEVLPEQTADDTDAGWGEHPDEADGADDDERLTREKPPHW